MGQDSTTEQSDLSPKKRHHKKRRAPYRAFCISFIITVVSLSIGFYCIDSLNLSHLIDKLFLPLARLSAFIILGLVVGQIIESTGWTQYLARLAGPLFRYSNLGPQCSAAFTFAFVSGIASNSMLYTAFDNQQIKKNHVYLANLINQLPAYFLHLPTTFFIIVPLTGKAGLIYFALTFSATLLRTFSFVLFGHFFIQPPTVSAASVTTENKSKNKTGIIDTLKIKLPRRILGIGVWVLPVYGFVFLATETGLFDKANQLVGSLFVSGFVPVEALSVVILSFAAEFTSGFAAAGALLNAGVITVKETVIALIIGNIIAFPLRALRHQLPRYIGIFSPKMGTQILLLGQLCRIFSFIAVTTVYWLLF